MPEESGRKHERWREKRWWIPGILMVLLVLVAVVVAVPPAVIRASRPDIRTASAADQLKAENDLRTTLVTMLAGFAVATGAVVGALNFRETSRQNRRVLELQRRGQVTERFTKAIDQLGESAPEKLDVRIGAVYALEQIAQDSPELHWPIVEILTAFIREHAKPDTGPQPGDQPQYGSPTAVALDRLDSRLRPRGHSPAPAAAGIGGDQGDASTRRHIAADIQAALTVLGRRDASRDRGQIHLANTELRGARLHKANLQGADFSWANLEAADLTEANLQAAYLYEVNLRHAYLSRANLQDASIFGANLQDANLEGANLQDAGLFGANLKSAKLMGANLQDTSLLMADLQGADFSEANLQDAGLFGANLQDAIFETEERPAAQGLSWEQLSQAEGVSEGGLPTSLRLAGYERAIESQPDDASAWWGKGVALDGLKRHEEALAAFEKAIELQPNYSIAWRSKGIVLDKLKRHEEALAAFEKAIQLQPDDASAWWGKGAALDGLKRHEGALAALEKAIELQPDYAFAWRSKGIVLDNLKRHEEALAAFEKANELQPAW